MHLRQGLSSPAKSTSAKRTIRLDYEQSVDFAGMTINKDLLTASKMSSLTGETCPTGLFSSWTRWIFGVALGGGCGVGGYGLLGGGFIVAACAFSVDSGHDSGVVFGIRGRRDIVGVGRRHLIKHVLSPRGGFQGSDRWERRPTSRQQAAVDTARPAVWNSNVLGVILEGCAGSALVGAQSPMGISRARRSLAGLLWDGRWAHSIGSAWTSPTIAIRARGGWCYTRYRRASWRDHAAKVWAGGGDGRGSGQVRWSVDVVTRRGSYWRARLPCPGEDGRVIACRCGWPRGTWSKYLWMWCTASCPPQKSDWKSSLGTHRILTCTLSRVAVAVGTVGPLLLYEVFDRHHLGTFQHNNRFRSGCFIISTRRTYMSLVRIF